MVRRHFGEGEAHAEAGVGVDDSGFGFEHALISHNFQLDERSFGERIKRIDVAAAQAELGGARGEARLRRQLEHLGGRDERTTPHGALLLVFSGSSHGQSLMRGALAARCSRCRREAPVPPPHSSKATTTFALPVQVGAAGVLAC